ncbi:hypothetical protein SCLCIDRAFT_26244 [Scleroderma citrinum Foug A]|uniref:Uncharacterized protein n=1 Tax=Scleroderma citrinum Foug A TaxID=1036808 RepID=A0A0C3A7P8_9AGAM|nr:hypothetical protein SCLCIDRAFT_26244 [Scleroderma citrinum Foug A]
MVISNHHASLSCPSPQLEPSTQYHTDYDYQPCSPALSTPMDPTHLEATPGIINDANGRQLNVPASAQPLQPIDLRLAIIVSSQPLIKFHVRWTSLSLVMDIAHEDGIAGLLVTPIAQNLCCHKLEDRAAKRKLTPYFAFTRTIHMKGVSVLDKPTIVAGVCERASKSQVRAESTLILHLACKGMDTTGCLPLLLKTALEDYHTKDCLEYVQVTFDFGTDSKLSRWKMKRAKLGRELVARKFQHKIIFVTVHSEITRGDLFAGKNAQGGDMAMEVNEFMKCLFGLSLERVVYGSTLFMLTCGPSVAFQDSFLAMKQTISRLQPEYTIAFMAPNFLSAVLKVFIMLYCVQVLIQGHSFLEVLHDLLDVAPELRMHTDVLLFYIKGLLSPPVVDSPSMATMGHRFAYVMSPMWGHSSMVKVKR